MKVFLLESLNVCGLTILIVLLIAAIAPAYEPPVEGGPGVTDATGTR